MKPKRSLPHSQAHETCTYPEPAPSSPYPHISFSEMHLIIIPHLLLVSELLYFPQVFLPKPCIHLSSPIRATYPAHLILLGFITRTILSGEYRSLSSSLYSFPHFPDTSPFQGPIILPNTLFSNTLSLRSSLNISNQDSHPYKTQAELYFCIS